MDAYSQMLQNASTWIDKQYSPHVITCLHLRNHVPSKPGMGNLETRPMNPDAVQVGLDDFQLQLGCANWRLLDTLVILSLDDAKSFDVLPGHAALQLKNQLHQSRC